MQVQFTIKATVESFQNLLYHLTKDAHLQAIPLDADQEARLLPYMQGPPADLAVPIPPEEMADIPTGSNYMLAGAMFQLGNTTFVSVPHEHSGLQGRIMGLFISTYVVRRDENGEPTLTHSENDERVAIGFKWVQIDKLLLVTMGCYEAAAEGCFIECLKQIRKIWPESRGEINKYLGKLPQRAPTATNNRDRTKERLAAYASIKAKRPDLGYEAVAALANVQYSHLGPHDKGTVRNTYKLTGTKWVKATSVMD